MAKKVYFGVLIIIIMLIFFSHKTLLKMFFPLEYSSSVERYSSIYGVDPNIIYSIINVESKFNADAVSKKGAVGLMQITPKTGKYIASLLNRDDYDEKRLLEPEVNIEFGTFYISKLYKDFNGNLNYILAAYNGGEGNVRKWIEQNQNDGILGIEEIPFGETREYIKRVNSCYRVYTYLYGSNKK